MPQAAIEQYSSSERSQNQRKKRAAHVPNRSYSIDPPPPLASFLSALYYVITEFLTIGSIS